MKLSSTTCLLVAAAGMLTATDASAPRFFPYYEGNFDYVGHDVSNAPGENIEYCVSSCIGVAQCGAVTFTSYNGGTCWFKSRRGEVVPKAGANSTVLWSSTAAAQQIGQLMPHTDFAGNDLSHVNNSDASQCLGICQGTFGCRAFAWNGDNNGTCWLKRKRGAIVADRAVYAGEAYPVDMVNPIFSPTTDFVDHDIANKPAQDQSECYKQCLAYPGCRAVTWTNYQNGTCWLKSGVDKVASNVFAFSAHVAFTEGGWNWETDNSDYVGNDIGSKTGVANAADCGPVCKSKANCKAFSWSNYQGGTCWLKSAKGQVVKKDGVLAATLA